MQSRHLGCRRAVDSDRRLEAVTHFPRNPRDLAVDQAQLTFGKVGMVGPNSIPHEGLVHLPVPVNLMIIAGDRVGLAELFDALPVCAVFPIFQHRRFIGKSEIGADTFEGLGRGGYQVLEPQGIEWKPLPLPLEQTAIRDILVLEATLDRNPPSFEGGHDVAWLAFDGDELRVGIEAKNIIAHADVRG